ncbi:hypothetical protein RRG08_007771 [Elysia crispata]|uniref:Uncharacterized protein n=1 Tax=Elysia crispata TaxID=231223 RepID=A0AAE1B251_9GAST|nr:hypothetical protein RRG08_007771 [Elysia crispata]
MQNISEFWTFTGSHVFEKFLIHLREIKQDHTSAGEGMSSSVDTTWFTRGEKIKQTNRFVENRRVTSAITIPLSDNRANKHLLLFIPPCWGSVGGEFGSARESVTEDCRVPYSGHGVGFQLRQNYDYQVLRLMR